MARLPGIRATPSSRHRQPERPHGEGTRESRLGAEDGSRVREVEEGSREDPDLQRRREVTRIDVGDYPEGIDFAHKEDRIFVANWFSNSVSVIDAETLEVTREIVTGDGSRAFGHFIMQ